MMPFKLSPKLSDYFLERYIEEFGAWAKNSQAIGPVKAIVLKEGPFADPSPNPEMGPILLQVLIVARPISHDTVLLEPATERDEKLIRDHVQKLQSKGIKSRHFWKEEPRAWIPTMPRIVTH
jgi:hypothetical protein